MYISQDLIKILRYAQHITVLTGAGISTESGIPTFREAQTGLWEKFDPAELASPQAFKANPTLVWDWYRWRRAIVSQANPNLGHIALANMEKITIQSGSHFTLITQNVDGLHKRAGSNNIIELHGNINRNRCCECETIADILPADDNIFCNHCGGFQRPDVVWFGENLPTNALQSAWEAAETCDIFFTIGTSTVVQPAANLPVIALQNGATLVELNPNDTPISTLATHKLQGPSGVVLPFLINSTWPEYM